MNATREVMAGAQDIGTGKRGTRLRRDDEGRAKALDPTGFCRTYAEARRRFLAAAEAAGARLHSEPIDAKGPRGEDLAIDFARLGPDPASRLVILSSGIHGVEGYLGSAVQTRWLESKANELPPGVAALFIHAINPYGFAWNRRVNEDNIDLNRNCLSVGEAYAGSPQKYEIIANLLDPGRAPRRFERLPFFRIGQTILRHGFHPLKLALVTGQYDHPETLFFGGQAPSTNMQILDYTLPALAGQPERVAHIDFHSGLGKRGEVTLLLEPMYAEERLEHLKSFFPGCRLEGTGGDDYEVTYPIRGGFLAWCRGLLPAEDYRPITAEFGTEPNLRVLEALYLENLAHHYGELHSAAYRRAKRRIREAFAPLDRKWRKRVSDKGVWLVDRAAAMVADDRRDER